MQLSILNILLIIVLFQSVLLIIFLVTSSMGKKVSNRILAFFFLLLVMNVADGLLSIHGFYIQHPQLAHLEDGCILLAGPSLYFYTRSIVFRDFQFTSKDIWHVLPFLLVTSLLLIFFHFQSYDQQRFIENAVVNRELPIQFYIVTGFVYVQIAVYMILSLQTVLVYRHKIKERFSDITKINLNWLVFLLLSVVIILLISLVDAMIPLAGPREWFDYTLLSVVVGIFIFINMVVIKGLRHPGIFSGISTDDWKVASPPVMIPSEVEQILHKLGVLMSDEKVYLEPDLSLDALAQKVGVASKKLSQVINEKLSVNFFDYINSLRIREAERIMQQSPDPRITVLEVMYQSGFNSKSSFNTIFKKKTGMTPSDYRRQWIR